MTNRKTVLITGASSGIGRALAELYASPETTLLLTGRNPQRLSETAAACAKRGATVETCATCVTEEETLKKQLHDWDDKYPIDIVIANAGISGGPGSTDGESDAQFREIMEINLSGTFNTVNPLIPRMRGRKKGQIVLMSSMAGFRGLPSAPAYSVSKNAVRAYAEALRPMLAPEGVGVSVICPGFIKTPMTDVNAFPMPFLMDAVEAAQKMKSGIEADKALIAFPWQLHLLMMYLTLMPRALADWILSKAPKKS